MRSSGTFNETSGLARAVLTTQLAAVPMTRFQVEFLGGLGLGARQPPQILNDFAGPRRPFERAVDQRLDVGQHAVDLQLLA